MVTGCITAKSKYPMVPNALPNGAGENEQLGRYPPMKHGLSWQTASLLHLIGSEGERIVKIANTKLTSSNVP